MKSDIRRCMLADKEGIRLDRYFLEFQEHHDMVNFSRMLNLPFSNLQNYGCMSMVLAN